MEAFFNSYLLVLVSEMGDKTQILSLILATRFKKPWTVLAGVFVATLLNHLLASWLGSWISLHVDGSTLRVALGVAFFIFAGWILIPDKEGQVSERGSFGAFVTTVVSFFLAEMGDKTQLATVALGARYASTLLVTLGTTAGMLTSNAVVIFLGERILTKVSMRWIRIGAAGLFVLFGAMILLEEHLW